MIKLINYDCALLGSQNTQRNNCVLFKILRTRPVITHLCGHPGKKNRMELIRISGRRRKKSNIANTIMACVMKILHRRSNLEDVFFMAKHSI